MKCKAFFLSILFVCALVSVQAQRTISFFTSDSLEVTADFYETDAVNPKYLLLFHQADYSRGEFTQLATRFIKLGFNSIAVDLRYGKEVNFINNETAMRAKLENKAISMIDCKKDMIAAIEYIKSQDSTAQIYLLGSSFSASLSLMVAKERKDITCVIGFSPGEFFGDAISVEQTIRGLDVPVYVGCPRSELYYVTQLMSGVKSKKRVIFKPETADGLHGAKTLWWESATRDEFWLSLLYFIQGLK